MPRRRYARRTPKFDVAQAGVAVRRGVGDQDAGDLPAVPREVPQVGVDSVLASTWSWSHASSAGQMPPQ